MAAALDERDPRQDLARSAPRHDRRIVTLHPLPIRERDVDRRATEGVAPLDHRPIEVRMRERDRADSALRSDRRDGRVIDVSDAVPENVAIRRSDEDGSLSDAER